MSLPPEELARFPVWFVDFDARVWDGQIESDSKSVKLDGLINEALADYKSGKARDL